MHDCVASACVMSDCVASDCVASACEQVRVRDRECASATTKQ